MPTRNKNAEATISTALRPPRGPVTANPRAVAPARPIVQAAAWVSLVVEILLVATGGLVRLTDSGLGCPTWPDCSAGHLVTTPALGIHGVIEFANRMITVALVVVAIAAVVIAIRTWRTRHDLTVLAGLQLISIPLQAVLGGITVLSKLNPWVVGAHFAFSMVLIALMTVFVVRARSAPGARSRVVPLPFAIGTHVASLLVAMTVVLGIITTGSGPHAGDAHSARNGLPQWLLQDLHSYPAFALAALSLVLFVATLRLRVGRRIFAALILALIAQITVGLIQAHTGLPPALVDIHELLAACLVAVMTGAVLSLKRVTMEPVSDPT